MSVAVITPPDPILTWEEAKAHLREDSDDEKAYVEALIAAATGWIDGPAGWLGRCLGPQLLSLHGEVACGRSRLPCGPVLEVESIHTFGQAAEPQLVPSSSYRLYHGHLVVDGGSSWVSEPDHVIQYWAGYGKRAEDGEGWNSEVPAPIKQAILLLVGQWFRTRSAVNVGNIVNAMPFAVDALLSPYRRWS